MKLSTFQIDTLNELVKALNKRDSGDIHIDWERGDSEDLIKVEIKSRSLRFWIYVDEAGISGENLDDFKSLSDLQSAFLARAKELV